MRLSIVVLILVLAVGSIVILLGFLTNQEYVQVSEISNQYNQQILEDLEGQIKNSTDIHLDSINEEIVGMKQIVNENKEELERVIEKLSQMESKP